MILQEYQNFRGFKVQGDNSMKENFSLNRLILENNKKMLEQYNAYVKEIANTIIMDLPDEDKEKIRKDSDYSGYHFGFGLYIRNNYIYGKVDIKVDADDMSSDIFYEIVDILNSQKKCKEIQKYIFLFSFRGGSYE